MKFLCDKWLLAVALTWHVSQIWSYSLRKIDDESENPTDLEIDFYANYETLRGLENDEKGAPDLFSSEFTTTKYGSNEVTTPLDSWSVVWYIASFGGLIAFFLIVSCSEWCCRRAVRNQANCNATSAAPSSITPHVADTPPPSYDQFAPPSYESICLGRQLRNGEKHEYDIYVVPVHALSSILDRNSVLEDAPPSYVNPNFDQEPRLGPAPSVHPSVLQHSTRPAWHY